jgi:hypothetical protein
MATDAKQSAKRAFVTVLLALAVAYSLVLGITRDSNDASIVKAYRRILLRAHPDKGGSTSDAQKLQESREAWEATRKASGTKGRPKGTSTSSGQSPGAAQDEVADPRTFQQSAKKGKGKRIHSNAVMLTYNGIRDQAHWHGFLAFVRAHVGPWKVKHWCATLEQAATGTLHIHLYVQFHRQADRCSLTFMFDGIAPRADQNDYRGEGLCRKRLQDSIDRGFFYVWADKIGTQRDADGAPCVEGNYMPRWTKGRFTYAVQGKWPFNLWKDLKLTHDTYHSYLYLCRENVLGRKRNLDAVRRHEEEQEEKQEMEAVVKRMRNNPDPDFEPFPEVPEAFVWLEIMKKELRRYPILVAHGPSMSGKTEWAKTLFKNPLEVKVGALVDYWPDGLRQFSRKLHDGLILDDVRDLRFLRDQQEKLQGKYDYPYEFASTPGGQCAYKKWLYQVPIVDTINNSTKNLDFLETDDFLKNPGNRVLVHFPLRAAV